MEWPQNDKEFNAFLDFLKSSDLKQKVLNASEKCFGLLHLYKKEEEIPLGASKFGGSPDLPQYIKWPIRAPYSDSQKKSAFYLKEKTLCRERANPNNTVKHLEGILSKEDLEAFKKNLNLLNDEKVLTEQENHYEELASTVAKEHPLDFILQLDLSELPTSSILPKKGRLYFFYDLMENPPGFNPSSKVGWKIIYDSSSSEDLERVNSPLKTQLDAAQIKSEIQYSLPNFMFKTEYHENFSTGELEHITELMEEKYGYSDSSNKIQHQLLGLPLPIQTTLLSQCILASRGIYCGNLLDESMKKFLTAENFNEWQLLFKIGPDENLNFGSINTGAYFVMMRTQDLLKLDFDNIWCVFQCT